MPHSRSSRLLLDFFASTTVADLPSLQAALGGVSAVTVFRYLKQVPYRRSYNHNGRYYCLHEPSRYDRFGLWSYEGIHFSADGSLKNTVRRLVHQAPSGSLHRELQEQLRVRVHNTLLELLRQSEIDRERVSSFYVYLHVDPPVRAAQLRRRREQIASQKAAEEVTDAVIIQVLLTLIRYPTSKAADVVRHLRGYSPPISMQQVQIIFDRYDLDKIGEKGGPSIC